MRRYFGSLVTLFLSLVAPVAAQTSPAPYLPSNEPNAKTLLADRIRFVREMYQLETAAMDKVAKDLTEQVPFHEKRRMDYAKTVSRIELAITLVANDANIAEADKATRVAHFQEQLSGIYAGLPLSLSNVIKRAEEGLSPDQVKAAHERINKRFADRLKGAPLSMAKIDGLLIPPVVAGKKPDFAASLSVGEQTAPSTAGQTQSTMTPPPVATTTPPPRPQPAAPKALPPSLANPLPAPPTPPQPVQPPLPQPPPRIIPPAPPESEWASYLDKAATKYVFSADQKKLAEKIIDQCKSRAVEQRDKSKGEYDSASKLGDAKAKTEKVADLNKPLDRLYDELVQRVESLATQEQRSKSEKAAPPATGK